MTVTIELTSDDVRVRPQVVSSELWTVTGCAGAGGVVAVDRVDGGLQVSVGDESAGRSRRTLVALRPDGSVLVAASSTPPALLVSPGGACTIPSVPGVPERGRLDTDQRLLVLSSDALDALPASLASVLQALPAQVTGRDPADLLTELFADLPRGSGVIIARRPATEATAGTHLEEATWGSAQRS